MKTMPVLVDQTAGLKVNKFANGGLNQSLNELEPETNDKVDDNHNDKQENGIDDDKKSETPVEDSTSKTNLSSKPKTTNKRRRPVKKRKAVQKVYDSDEDRLRQKYSRKKKKCKDDSGSESDCERGPYIRYDKTGKDVHSLRNPKSYTRMISKIEDSNWNKVPIPKDAPLLEGPWMCAMCQLRTGRQNLGDLFGPFYILVGEESCPTPPFFDPDQIVSPKRCSKYEGECPNSPSHSLEPPSTSSSNRKRKKGLPPRFYIDVYIHSDCLLWTPGLYMEGWIKIQGFDEFIGQYWQQRCSKCKLVGASLGCVQHLCSNTYHYHCAVSSGCLFKETNLSVYCSKHSQQQKHSTQKGERGD